MGDSKITSEKFIMLSREYLDDALGEKRVNIKKEHYYIFAISNFIATKEYFLKKKNNRGSTKVVFNMADNEDILPMILEFYNGIKSKNKSFKTPLTTKAKDIIEIVPTSVYSDEEYQALYLFHEIRNALSHAGNYKIKEKNDECFISIKSANMNEMDIPIALFDFIAFYINSYVDGVETDEILQNYLVYKESRDNKKYYSFESKNAIDRIVSLLSKTQIRIKKKTLPLTRNRNGSDSEEYYEKELEEFVQNYGKTAYEILEKMEKFNLSDEQKHEFIVQFNIIARADKRISSIKIDKCIENIKSILRLDRKSASLYSHSIILFTNREEPNNTNEQTVINNIKKIGKAILSINIESIEVLGNEAKKKIIEEYKHAMEKMLQELPNMIRINEHRYRNAIFHNNVSFDGAEIHFWNQKDNTNPNDVHTYEINMPPETYNFELKSIENYNSNVGEITIAELFDILIQYYEVDIINEIVGKLWNINQIDKELLRWNMSLLEFIENLDARLKELSPESR